MIILSSRLVGVMCYYESNACTKIVCDYLRIYLDDLILVKGRWKQTPVINSCEPAQVFETEMDHRTYALQQVPVGDYAVIIDSDEIWWGNWLKTINKLHSNKPIVGWVNEVDPSCSSTVERARIVKISKGIHYYKDHWNIRTADNKILPTIRDRRNSRHRVHPLYFYNTSRNKRR